jgi:hypothetical protein
MAEIVYVLCALASVACAGLLLRSYGRSRLRLILWTGLCFIALAANNVLLLLDLMVVPSIDLSTLRIAVGLAGAAVLLYGMIMEVS